VDITDPNVKNYGNSYFQLKIHYNRKTTNNIENSKTIVIFPTETASIQYNQIWTGATSCFRFVNNNNELNNITSEVNTVAQHSGRYTILNNPYIYLQCTKPTYNVIQNNYQITLNNSTVAGYTLSQYIKAINSAITTTNDSTINTKNTMGDFNMNTFNAYIDNNSYFNLNVDINRVFTQDMYYLDLSGSFLNLFIGLSGEYLNGVKDLSGSTYMFTGSFEENSFYQMDSNIMLSAYPSRLNYGNQNARPFIVPTDGIGTVYHRYQDIATAVNKAFINYVDADGVEIFSGTHIVLTPNELTGLVDCEFTISMKKVLTQRDYAIGFVDYSSFNDSSGNIVPSSSSWNDNLNIDTQFLATNLTTSGGIKSGGYNLSNINNGLNSYTQITGTDMVTVNTIKFIDGVNNFFYLIPWEVGVTTKPPYYVKDSHANDIKFTIPATNNGTVIPYTRDNLINTLNQVLNSLPISQGSSIKLMSINNSTYTRLRLNVNKIYTASDYKLVFYDQLSFNRCYPGVTYIRNTTWDTTIGWLIGFHSATEFALSDYGNPGETIQIVGDTTVSVNVYDYFLLCIDDYNQNHLNDGMVTVSTAPRTLSLPSYANKANYTCDPVTGLLTYNSTITNQDNNRLTQKQLYSLTEIANSKRVSSIIGTTSNVNGKSYGSGPFIKDVFGFIPMKTAGLAPGAVYVDYGGTLQNQERAYFGPVNIYKMGIQLVSNRGDIVDLNGSDWSFSFIVEQLYQQKPTIDKTKKK
jgi:hypothetical protein